MGPGRKEKAPVVWLLFWFLIAYHGIELCASVNHEGIALLRFKEAIEADPCGALSDWDEGSTSPCSWFGVGCSDDGRVITLNLENLGLTGMLSPEIGKLNHMNSLILRNNSFYGIIPTVIGDLLELKVLDLGYNNFSGTIPSELGSILSLEFLFLKGNKLSGGLSSELHELIRLCESQVHEDLSCSNMASTIRYVENATIRRLVTSKQKHCQKKRMLHSGPSVVTPPVKKSRVIAVPGIHPRPHSPFQFIHPREAPHPPTPLLPPPSEPIPLPPAPPVIEQPTGLNNKSNSSSIIFASVGAAICFLVAALSAVYYLYYQRKKTSTVVPLSASMSRQLRTATFGGITLYRRSELETACESFSNIIGTLPGFTLYKGTLRCRAEIAVVSTLVTNAGGWSSIDEEQFKNKIEVLSKVNHKNFMNLVGYCEDEEPFTRMMVFEYVSNGSLFEHLHVKEAEHLNWQSRLRIAMGVIYCLNYMHQQNCPLILRNLSSSCIYLTEDNAAKISDISFWDDKRVVGSVSYDEDCTVFKFALLLLEMISGRHSYSDDNGLLVQWAYMYLTGSKPLMGMVDPILKSVPEEHVTALSELIQSCIHQDPKERPSVPELTKRMQEITGISPDQAIPRNNALWWAELEIITS